MFSAIVAVHAAYCALQIVRLTWMNEYEWMNDFINVWSNLTKSQFSPRVN